jgi:general secretion pathway protein L
VKKFMAISGHSATLQLFNFGSGLIRNCADAVQACISDISTSSPAIAALQTTIVVSKNGFDIIPRAGGATKKHTGGVEGFGKIVFDNLHLSDRKQVVLRVSRERAVVKRIHLPGAAKDSMGQILRNKIESIAPWPVDEVLWGYRMIEPESDEGLAIDVGIVSRKLIDEICGELKQNNVQVSALIIADHSDNDRHIVVDHHAVRRRAGREAIVKKIIFFPVICLAGACAYGGFSWWSAEAKLVELENEILVLQQDVAKSGPTSGPDGLSAANAIFEGKRDRSSFIAILDAMTKAIPDDTWLDSLALQEDVVVVTGRGKTLAGIIERIESSDMFSNAEYVSAIQRDSRENVDIFSISTVVDHAGTKK